LNCPELHVIHLPSLRAQQVRCSAQILSIRHPIAVCSHCRVQNATELSSNKSTQQPPDQESPPLVLYPHGSDMICELDL
jgi:hypothetical protein